MILRGRETRGQLAAHIAESPLRLGGRGKEDLLRQIGGRSNRLSKGELHCVEAGQRSGKGVGVGNESEKEKRDRTNRLRL